MAEDPRRRLDSWKEIADYLGREVRTTIRWEKERQLPVHRVPGGNRATVFAFTDELDAWLTGKRDSELGAGIPDRGNGHAARNLEERQDLGLGLGERPAGRTIPAVGPRPRVQRSALRFVLLALFATAILIAVIPVRRLMRSPRAPRVLRFQPLATAGDEGQNPPFLTDGVHLYFTENTPAGEQIMKIPVTGGQPESVPSGNDLRLLDISPDGSRLLAADAKGIGPTAVNPGEMEEERPLFTLPLAGGTPHSLGLTGHDGAWSPDGGRIAYALGQSIQLARNDGTSSRMLVSLDGIASQIRWSPDGTALRFVMHDPNRNARLLWQVSAEGTSLRRIVSLTADLNGGFLGNWTADGRYFLLSIGSPHARDIWALRERSGPFGKASEQPLQLTAGPILFSGPTVSRDGSKIFATGVQDRGELVRYDGPSSRFVPYLGGISVYSVSFSPDGASVAYSIFPERTLWRSRIDGSQRVQLTFPPLAAATPRWSPDGKMIAFDSLTDQETWKMYLIPSEGGTPQEVVPGKTGQAIPAWSPDGQRLAFAQVRGSTGIQVLDLRTREVSTIPDSEGHWAPKWSPDGRYILAENSHSPGLAIYDFRAGKWAAFGRITFPINYAYWSHGGKYVYFNSNAAVSVVYRVRVTDEKMEPVLSLVDPDSQQSYGVWFGLTPDDSVLATRSTGSAAIYALDVEWP